MDNVQEDQLVPKADLRLYGVRVGEECLARWIREGKFPQPVKIGREVMFSRRELLAHLQGLLYARTPLGDAR